MRHRDVIAFGLLAAVLLASCQGPRERAVEDEDLKRLLPVVEARVGLLASPEMMDPLNGEPLCHYFSASELADMMKYHEEVGAMVAEYLRQGHHGAAYLAGYLGTAEAIPIMWEKLLQERYYYGWEGTDRSDEKSYLGDDQFPHHMAYVLAIEKISGQPVWEVVKLDAAERALLEDEAAKADPANAAWGRHLAAKWLLKKLKVQ